MLLRIFMVLCRCEYQLSTSDQSWRWHIVAICVLHTKSINCDTLLHHFLAQKGTIGLLNETLSDADLLSREIVSSEVVLQAWGVVSQHRFCTVCYLFKVFIILEEGRTRVFLLLKSFVVLSDELWGIGIDHLRLVRNLLSASKQFGRIDFVNWGIHGTLVCNISCVSDGQNRLIIIRDGRLDWGSPGVPQIVRDAWDFWYWRLPHSRK